jgi:hypothetical protein
MRRRDTVGAGVRASATQSLRSKAGNRAEDLAELLNAQCAAQGVAWLWRVPTPTRVVGKGKPGAPLPMAFVKRATVDYLGVMRDGRGVAVEVKRLEGKRLNLGRIEPHQRACLDLVAAAGGVAVLLVVTDAGAVALDWLAVRGLMSIGPGELERVTVRGEAYLAEWVA